jgi:hypothetical protein
VKPYQTCALACLIACAQPMTAAAGDLPREGTDVITNNWVRTSVNVLQLGEHQFRTYELVGVARNESGSGLLNATAFRCTGRARTDGRTMGDNGACLFTDGDGDQVMVTYGGHPQGGGPETLIAGTGKYAGISGAGEWNLVLILRNAEDGRWRAIVQHKLSWKLP